MSWDLKALPPAVGRTMVVTGGNAGVGYFTSEGWLQQYAGNERDGYLLCHHRGLWDPISPTSPGPT